MYFIFSVIIETVICFSESTVSVNEDQGSPILLLHHTNLSSADIIVIVVTTDGTAIGEI